MATAVPQVNAAPYAARIGETALDTTTANTGNVNLTLHIDLVGTVSQVQADWAALLAATMTCPTALAYYSGED